MLGVDRLFQLGDLAHAQALLDLGEHQGHAGER
jgi:hypothetical protein